MSKNNSNKPFEQSTFIDIKTISKLYKICLLSGYCKFASITDERFQEISTKAYNYREYYLQKLTGTLSLMSTAASSILASSSSLGLANGNEMMLYFIKLVDPELKFLEAYETYNMQDDLKNALVKFYGIYDKSLIRFEKHLNERFSLYDSFDLIERNNFKR